jgi:SAM-dependent methyltransferase
VDDYIETNRKHWDELVPIHEASAFYDVDRFRAGESRLHALEREEVGDVHGKTLLHLQCHFGLDTLSWAREGAAVTGVDFSHAGIEAARRLVGDTGISARFIWSDVYTLPQVLDERFDIVYTSYGTYFWLPDLAAWARVVSHFLAPGGFFYIADFHPFMAIFADEPGTEDLRVHYPYFPAKGPIRLDDDGSYADRTARLQHRTTFSWPHSIGEIVTALAEAGLRIEYLHEFRHTVEQWFPFMDRGPDGLWRLQKHGESLPLLFSIKATKP